MMPIAPQSRPEELCPCGCHDELDEQRQEHVHQQVRLDDPLETAVACAHCHPWHLRARRRPRVA